MWQDLKSILKDGKTKCVIIEDGEPRYVVIGFEEYQQLQGDKKDNIVSERSGEGREENFPNGDLAQARNADYSSSVNIEDLPF